MTRPEQTTATADRTAWGRHLQTPLRQFLRTETGSAAVLLAATIGALVWTNLDTGSYDALWQTQISLRLGGFGVSQDLHGWVNSGLDTERFVRDLRDHAYTSRVAEDVDTADLGSVSGTPTFFINGQRHYGAYDIDSLKQAVRPPGHWRPSPRDPARRTAAPRVPLAHGLAGWKTGTRRLLFMTRPRRRRL